MEGEKATWNEFKKSIYECCANYERFIFRGHKNSKWKLETTFHRHGGVNIPRYINDVILGMTDIIEVCTKIKFNTDTGENLATFVSLLQHHGFPTPLLDWTFSPFISAYFAFKDADEKESENVAIYKFDAYAWGQDFENVLNDVNKRGVSLLRARSGVNAKNVTQQCIQMWSTIKDIEEYIDSVKMDKKYLSKVVISATEKHDVMNELQLMGINGLTMFTDVSGACLYGKEKFFKKDSCLALEQSNMKMQSRNIA